MGKIRTVKPEFFRHHELYMAEKKYGLPIKLYFIGLWTCADREGRFSWKPMQLKLDIDPWNNDVDIEEVLTVLWAENWLIKYENGGKIFGYIPTFLEHQRIRPDEGKSFIPSHKEEGSSLIRYDVVTNPTTIRMAKKDTFLDPKTDQLINNSLTNDDFDQNPPPPSQVSENEEDTKFILETERTRNDTVTNRSRGNGNGNGNGNGSISLSPAKNFSTPAPAENGPNEIEPGTNLTGEPGTQDAPPRKNPVFKTLQYQTHGNGPRIVSFFSDDSYTAKEVEKAIMGSAEALVMCGDLWKYPEQFQRYFLETWIRETIAKGEDQSSGKLRKDFNWYVINQLKRIEKQYSDEAKSLEWFESELKRATTPEMDASVVLKFKNFYLTVMPTGRYYFQNRTNFDVARELKDWITSEREKGGRKNGKAQSVVGKGKLTKEVSEMTPEEQMEYYRLHH